jgi:hypothetical protein
MCNDSTFLSNITSFKNKMIWPYQLLLGCKPKLPESLQSFGEIGVVMTKNDIQGKLTNRGTPCMFMEYSVNHVCDVYRMLNMDTKKVINSREIVWMTQVYKDWNVQEEKKCELHDENDEDDEDEDDDAVKPKILAVNKN